MVYRYFILAVCLLGVIFPLISELLTGQKVTFGPPWYEQNTGPLFAGLLFLMILVAARGLLGLPFSIWAVFVIEERFGIRFTAIYLIADGGLVDLRYTVIDGHIDFIRQCRDTGRTLKHLNRRYDFPVMTRQETELFLNLLTDIRVQEKNGFEVSYSDAAGPVFDQPAVSPAENLPLKPNHQLELFGSY